MSANEARHEDEMIANEVPPNEETIGNEALREDATIVPHPGLSKSRNNEFHRNI